MSTISAAYAARVVVSAIVSGHENLPAEFQTVLNCEHLLLCMHVPPAVHTTSQLAPYVVLFTRDTAPVTSLIQDTIGRVIEWDAVPRTCLIETLFSCVSANANANLAQAARTLGLHANTVAQRLDRIDKPLTPGWRQSDHLLRVSPAVRLHTLADTRRRDGTLRPNPSRRP